MKADILQKSEYLSLDGPIDDPKRIAKELMNMGDWPTYYEEEAIEKALSNHGIDVDKLKKGGRINIANLSF